MYRQVSQQSIYGFGTIRTVIAIVRQHMVRRSVFVTDEHRTVYEVRNGPLHTQRTFFLFFKGPIHSQSNGAILFYDVIRDGKN